MTQLVNVIEYVNKPRNVQHTQFVLFSAKFIYLWESPERGEITTTRKMKRREDIGYCQFEESELKKVQKKTRSQVLQ